MKKANQTLKTILYFCFALLLGCDDRNAAELAFENYINDLNRSTWVHVTSKETSFDLLSIPSPRSRRSELTQFDIGIIDFLSLQQCDIGAIVGHKNSILGKVMPDSQRLLYELDIIRAIDECSIESDALRAELSLVRDIKKTELTKAFSNSFWAGKESGAFFSLSNGLISMSPDESAFTSLQDSLAYLVGLMNNLQNVPKISSESLEGHFQQIYESEYAGKLLLTLVMLTRKLDEVSDALESIRPTNDFCSGPMKFLRQQFKAHYVDKIQPYMARVNAVAFRILPKINLIQDNTQPLTNEFNDFLSQWSMAAASSNWVAYQSASKRHALIWSALFQKCSIKVGNK